MAAKGIDLEQVYFALFPFGTGNDLAQVLGWGGRPSQEMETANLDWILGRLLDAREDYLSLFEVEVVVREAGGDLLFPKGRDAVSFGKKRVRKVMTNYFSLGLCAQTGHMFEKKRTKI